MVLNFVYKKLDEMQTNGERPIEEIVAEEILPKLKRYKKSSKELHDSMDKVIPEARFAKPDKDGHVFIKSLDETVTNSYCAGYMAGYDEAMRQIKEALMMDLENDSI